MYRLFTNLGRKWDRNSSTFLLSQALHGTGMQLYLWGGVFSSPTECHRIYDPLTGTGIN